MSKTKNRYSTKKLMGNVFIWDRNNDRYIALCPRREDADTIRDALNKQEKNQPKKKIAKALKCQGSEFKCLGRNRLRCPPHHRIYHDGKDLPYNKCTIECVPK